MSYNKEWWEAFRRHEVEDILELTAEKNSDYTGGDGCDNPFENFDASSDFGVEPLTGICIRMQDKFQRAKALCSAGELKHNSKGDQAKDIFRDLVGYSLIAIGMLERDKS